MNGFGEGMTDIAGVGGTLEEKEGGMQLYLGDPRPLSEPKRGLACVVSPKERRTRQGCANLMIDISTLWPQSSAGKAGARYRPESKRSDGCCEVSRDLVLTYSPACGLPVCSLDSRPGQLPSHRPLPSRREQQRGCQRPDLTLRCPTLKHATRKGGNQSWIVIFRLV